MVHPFDICNDAGNIKVNERLNYVLGQVLGVKEFQQEQTYFLQKARLQNRSLHGYGTVWGLEVTTGWASDSDNNTFFQIKVKPGLAIDMKGREVSIQEELCADLDKWLAGNYKTLQQIPGNDSHVKVYVILCYRYSEEGKQKILGDPCRSDDDTIQPTRILDAFELKLLAKPPDQLEDDRIRKIGELLSKIDIDPTTSSDDTKVDLTQVIKELQAAVDDPSKIQNLNIKSIPRAQFKDVLGEVLQHWITHTRPTVNTAGDDCILLATIELELDNNKVKKGTTSKVDNLQRPYLLHTRLLQELLIANAQKVREAFVELHHIEQKGCTFIAFPDSDWQKIFEELRPNQDAQICFQVGTYQFTKPITIEGKGHITISGIGQGAQLLAPQSESVFIFQDCKSVTVRNLYAESCQVGTQRRELPNATLMFINCPQVIIEHVALKCGAAPVRAVACIAVLNDSLKSDNIRIYQNDLLVGHQQIGILLLNVMRAQIEDNVLSAALKPESLSLQALLENNVYRSKVRRLLIRRPRLGKAQDNELLVAGVPRGLATLGPISGHSVWFNTDESLTETWKSYVSQNQPKGVQSDRDFYFHLKNVGDQILLKEGVLGPFTDFKKWYEKFATNNPSFAAQGIVIGGKRARDIRILNNTIRDAEQGIHVGLRHTRQPTELTDERTLKTELLRLKALQKAKQSELELKQAELLRIQDRVRRGELDPSEQTRASNEVTVTKAALEASKQQLQTAMARLLLYFDAAGTVEISSNHISVFRSLPGDRHGIFVGNCESLIVQNNYCQATGFRYATLEQGDPLSNSPDTLTGIRIFGYLGPRVIIRQNHLDNQFAVGIRLVALETIPPNYLKPRWVIADNVAPSSSNAVDVRVPRSITVQKDNND